MFLTPCRFFFQFSALEGAESTVIMASGMSASTVMLLALVPAGGHIVTTTDCYRKTRIFIETVLPKMGITVHFMLSFRLQLLCVFDDRKYFLGHWYLMFGNIE